MPNLYDRLGAVRDRLRHPRANRPGDGDCLRALCTHIKILRAKRRNTGNAWDFADKPINVQANKAKYQISDIRVGVPFAIVTKDDANPNHYQRIIPFYSPQNLAFNWGMPNNVAQWNVNFDGSTHSAERVAFYWSNGVPYLEFQPTPALPATYLCRFVVGDSVDMMSLADDLSLGECGDALAEVRAAASLLPFADWVDDKAENKEMRVSLGTTLDWEEKLLDEQFTADALVPIGTSIGHMWMPE